MRICMLAYTFYESDNRVRRYAEALARRGDEVDAVVLRRGKQSKFDCLNGVNIYRIQRRARNERSPVAYLGKLLLFFFASLWLLAKQSFRKKYDVIHVHSVPDFEVFATIVPRIMGARIILDIHDIVPEFYASKFGVNENSFVFRSLALIEKLSIRYSDHVIISNDIWKERLIQRSVRPEKCTAIINYPDPAIFSRRTKLQRDRAFTLCYPGTLNHHQGLDIAVLAVAKLRDSLPNLRFLIIGDGPDRDKLRAIIEKNGLSDSIRMRGSIPIEEVADTIATVDLGVVPKRNNSFGNEAFSTKIMEFMAMGIPVLASRTRIDEFYFGSDLVQFFESGNIEDLAAKIEYLMNNEPRRTQLSANALAFIRDNNWDVRKGCYFEIVDKLAARNHTT
jgi:glycosyltransferase involved in cell wall biosynthesis